MLAANAPALDVLRGNKGLSDRGGTLHAQLPADDGRLQRLLKRALPGGRGADGEPGRPRLRFLRLGAGRTHLIDVRCKGLSVLFN